MKKNLFLFIVFFASVSFGLHAQEQNHFKGVPLKQEKKILELLSKLQSSYSFKKAKTNFKVEAYKPDSLALVALYDSTNGDKWTNNTQWLKGKLNTWYGISINDSGYVTTIDLRKNNLIGTIPTGICSLNNLQVLSLSNNELTGIIPAQIGNLNSLQYLGMYYNQLTGTIPPEIGNLSHLQFLALYFNKLSGAIPAEIGNLSSLQILGLSWNQLTGKIPPEIGNLKNLKKLFADFNQLTGTIPHEIGKLSNLRDIALHYNQLTGPIPAEIGNLRNLRSMLLYNNQLTGAIPPEIGNLKNLQNLYLYNNQLTGKIPPEIGNLRNLLHLFLYNNQLTGAIPIEIGNLRSLQILYLSSNKLSGTIPAEIGNLKNLRVLDLSLNHFTGKIPHEIGNLKNLVTMLLSSNQFTEIPAEINNMDSLVNLDLNNNRFAELHALSSLTHFIRLEIKNNYLTFGDIEPIIEDTRHIALYSYAPQAKVGKKESRFLNPGDNVTISVSVSGKHNTYQWYKNSTPVRGATATSYSIRNFVAANDTGAYYCEIKNTVATALTLTSEPIHVSEKTYHNLTFDVSDGTNVLKGATVSLTGYGNQATSTIGVAIFSNVASENNLVYTVTDTGYNSITDSINVAHSDVTINITLSVTPAKKPTAHLKIYPNPSNGLIKIESNFELNGKLEILNITGKIVYSAKIKSEKKTIDLRNLPKGMYFIKVNSGNYSKTEKLVIN